MKRVKASEIVVTNKLRAVVSSALTPVEAWENIPTPDVYLESKVGKYLRGMEEVLNRAVEMNDLQMTRTLLLDLLKMTKFGRPKADVNIGGVSKLRDEEDFSKVSTDKLRALLGKGALE